MRTLYVETSAVLTWLLGESRSDEVISFLNKSENIVTSIISLIETERALIRAEIKNLIKPADLQVLKGVFSDQSASWTFLKITDSIRDRACSPFPVEPVRSLDAIHLATALEFLLIYKDLSVLTYDNRIIDNLDPLGLSIAKI